MLKKKAPARGWGLADGASDLRDKIHAVTVDMTIEAN
jgi:hypothetical protein